MKGVGVRGRWKGVDTYRDLPRWLSDEYIGRREEQG